MQYQDFSGIQTTLQMTFLLKIPELFTACVHHGLCTQPCTSRTRHFGSSHMLLIAQLFKSTEFQDQEILMLKFKSCRRANSSCQSSPSSALLCRCCFPAGLRCLSSWCWCQDTPASLISGHYAQTFLALDFKNILSCCCGSYCS